MKNIKGSRICVNFFPCLVALPEGLYFDIKRENEKNNAGLQNQAVLIKKGTQTSTKGENINNVFLEIQAGASVFFWSYLMVCVCDNVLGWWIKESGISESTHCVHYQPVMFCQ